MAATVSLESLFLQLLGRLESTGRCPVAQRRSLRVEIRTLELWRAVIGECLATFFYVFLVCGAHVSWPGYAEPSVLGIALTAGAAAATLSQCYGHISGCHMNPAVTLATFATRKVSPLRALLYVTAQCGGAIAGAALLYGIPMPGNCNVLINRASSFIPCTPYTPIKHVFLLLFFVRYRPFTTIHPSRSTQGKEGADVGRACCAPSETNLSASEASAALSTAQALFATKVLPQRGHRWVVYWFGPVAGGLLAGLIYEYIFDTKKGSRALKQSLEDADKESNTDDDYEDPDAKITKYATVAQSPKGGASGHCRGSQQQQQQQYEAAAGFRPAANTYSPTPSSAFPAATDTYGGSHAAGGTYAAPIYGTRLGNALRTLPARLEYGQGPGSTKF
ncbi:unnamed protein product [Ixodes hexagonus]